MGSVIKKITKEVSRFADRAGRELKRTGEKAIDEVGRTGERVGKEIGRSAEKVAKEAGRLEDSHLGRFAIRAATGFSGLYDMYKLGKVAVEGGNSLEWMNAVQDTLSLGASDAAEGINSDYGRSVFNYGAMVAGAALSLTGVGAPVGMAIAGGAMAMEQGQQKAAGKQYEKEAEAEAEAYQAEQKRLNDQAERINSIYSQSPQTVYGNAYYDQYRNTGYGSNRNAGRYGIY